MNYAPIYESRHANVHKTLHVGVEVRYEEQDAEYLVHILRFFETYAGEQKRKFANMPAIAHDGSKMKAGPLLQQFEQFEEGQRTIYGVVSIYFGDQMRPVFDAYMSELRQIKDKALKDREWTEAHPFYLLLSCFELIAPWFFPDKTALH